MNITRIHALHAEIQKVFEHIKSQEFKLIQLLQQLDREFGYKALGYASLWEYAVRGLGMTESQASSYIVVSRKAMQVPALGRAIEAGELSVSKAKRITSAIHFGNAEVWIEKARSLTQRELEREIFRADPQTHLDPKLRQKDRLYRMVLSVTDQFLTQLEDAQELMGENNREVALERILEDYLDKKDPVRKAERARRKSETQAPVDERRKGDLKVSLSLFSGDSTQPEPSHSSRNVQRRVPAAIQHLIHLRDRGVCQHFFPDGRKCQSRRGIHLHHEHEFGAGGGHEPSNLRTYCRAHHQLIHFQRDMRLEA